jgi:hypothetical protein
MSVDALLICAISLGSAVLTEGEAPWLRAQVFPMMRADEGMGLAAVISYYAIYSQPPYRRLKSHIEKTAKQRECWPPLGQPTTLLTRG